MAFVSIYHMQTSSLTSVYYLAMYNVLFRTFCAVNIHTKYCLGSNTGWLGYESRLPLGVRRWFFLGTPVSSTTGGSGLCLDIVGDAVSSYRTVR